MVPLLDNVVESYCCCKRPGKEQYKFVESREKVEQQQQAKELVLENKDLKRLVDAQRTDYCNSKELGTRIELRFVERV